MKAKHLARLIRSLEERREVCVDRRLADGGRTYGFVLGLSTQLLLLHQVYDFHLDGCRVYRVQDIEKVQSGEFESALQRIMEGEGLLDQVGISSMPPLDDMSSMLRHACEHQLPVIIEGEALEADGSDEDRFLIGYVVRVGKKRCHIHHFDPLAGWDEVPQRIRIEHITCVQLESPYTDAWLRHIDPCPSLAGPTETEDRAQA